MTLHNFCFKQLHIPLSTKQTNQRTHISIGTLLTCFACAFILLCQSITVCAKEETVYTNSQTGYEVVIRDEANLLTENELASLQKYMTAITKYGNVAYITITENNYSSTSYYASETYYDLFGSKSGILFLIDMDNRMLFLYSDGAIYKVITDTYADIITDNVYKYASNGDYYTCSLEAYKQIDSLLNGQRIAKPMKYICNILLAIILAALLNYCMIKVFSGNHKPSRNQLLSGVQTQCNISNVRTNFIHQSKTYSPQSSGNGKSGSGSNGHHSSSSHHHSGGGGGHKF